MYKVYTHYWVISSQAVLSPGNSATAGVHLWSWRYSKCVWNIATPYGCTVWAILVLLVRLWRPVVSWSKNRRLVLAADKSDSRRVSMMSVHSESSLTTPAYNTTCSAFNLKHRLIHWMWMLFFEGQNCPFGRSNNKGVVPFAAVVSTCTCACIDETPGISGTYII